MEGIFCHVKLQFVLAVDALVLYLILALVEDLSPIAYYSHRVIICIPVCLVKKTLSLMVMQFRGEFFF